MSVFFEMLLRGLVSVLMRLFLLVVLFPVALVIATPIIFIRAGFLARRREWKFGNAVADGYDNLWLIWSGAFERDF